MALAPLSRHLPLRLAGRGFSTTRVALGVSARVENDKSGNLELADFLPPYPYPAQVFKQADRGLYGGQRIQFGNNVGPKSKTKTRRRWEVNTVSKRVWSHALHRHVRVRVSTRVLRTIDKVGGLDEYLLGEKQARVKELGRAGWLLRWAVMRSPAVRARFELQSREIGLRDMRRQLRELEETAVEEGREEEQTATAERTRQDEELDRQAEEVLQGTVSLHDGAAAETESQAQAISDIDTESQAQAISDIDTEGKVLFSTVKAGGSTTPFARVLDSRAAAYTPASLFEHFLRTSKDQLAEVQARHRETVEAELKKAQARMSDKQFELWRAQIPGWHRLPRKVIEAEQLKMLRRRLSSQWTTLISKLSERRAKKEQVQKNVLKSARLHRKNMRGGAEYSRALKDGAGSASRSVPPRPETESLAAA